MEEAKRILLHCATPESLVRLSRTHLRAEAHSLMQQYFEELNQGSLEEYLVDQLVNRNSMENKLIMVSHEMRAVH